MPYIVLSENGAFKLYDRLISQNKSHIGHTGQQCKQDVECKVQNVVAEKTGCSDFVFMGGRFTFYPSDFGGL